MNEVSLYIPCFNAGETIGYCLEAVLRQTHPLENIIVVDDGSTDNTIDVVSRYPVRLIRHIDNRGLVSARNTAIKNINTEFVAALDADCIPDPNWLERLLKRFNSHEIAGVGGRLVEADLSTVFDYWRCIHMRQYWDDRDVVPPFLFGSNTVFRKDVLVKTDLYNQDYRNNYEDVDLCNRLKIQGYILVYESKAIARHLKKDNIGSLLNNHWMWRFGYYKEKGFYSSEEKLILKLKDNLGLANRYIEEDIASNRCDLVYLDFLLALHHSLKDFGYFFYQRKKVVQDNSLLSFWLVLLDSRFFYQFDYGKIMLSTLLREENAFLQNIFASILISGNLINSKFKNTNFKKILYKHILFAFYKITDDYFLDKLNVLIEEHPDWSHFYKKEHAGLNMLFLKNIFFNFQSWLAWPVFNFHNIIKMIESSAEETERVVSFNNGN